MCFLYWFRWELFPKGHPKSGVHMRMSELARSGGILAASDRYERIPKISFHVKNYQVAVQYCQRQEDMYIRVCLQK